MSRPWSCSTKYWSWRRISDTGHVQDSAGAKGAEAGKGAGAEREEKERKDKELKDNELKKKEKERKEKELKEKELKEKELKEKELEEKELKELELEQGPGGYLTNTRMSYGRAIKIFPSMW